MQNLKKKLNFPYIIQRTLYNSEKKTTNDFLAFANRSKLTLSKKYTKRKISNTRNILKNRMIFQPSKQLVPPCRYVKFPKERESQASLSRKRKRKREAEILKQVVRVEKRGTGCSIVPDLVAHWEAPRVRNDSTHIHTHTHIHTALTHSASIPFDNINLPPPSALLTGATCLALPFPPPILANPLSLCRRNSPLSIRTTDTWSMRSFVGAFN